MRKVLSLFAFVVVLAALSAVSASAQTLTCSPGVNHCAFLSWTAPTGTATITGYHVYRSNQTGGCATVTASTCTQLSSPTAVNYADGSLAASTTYFWVVTAYNANGESAPSNEVSATTQPDPPPSAPTGLTVVAK